MIPPEKPDNELPELITRMAIGFLIVMLALAFLFGCASPRPPKRSECHVLRVDEITETLGDREGSATREKWLAWCGEGRYVVFRSSVAPGDLVRFTEYQEDNQLQIYGAIEGPK